MMKRTNSRVLMTLILGMCFALLAVPGWAGQGAKLMGPVAGGSQGAPFAAPAFDLESQGYVAEEYFLEGEASAYRLAEGTEHTADGRWKTERETASVPYRTRILVVRPTEESRFNGTVVVHWQNVTAGYELGSVAEGSEYLRGYAWVGVSAQTVGVNGFPGPDAAGLMQWDPERYDSLEHPGDAYSYDIYTQAARAVGRERDAAGLDPMGGLDVERIIAAGASQSAGRLRTYINGVHPVEKLFDGFMPYIDFASPVPFAADQGGGQQGGRGGRGGRVASGIRTDLGVPVFVVNSETETPRYFPARQADTDTYRFWEVSGTSHVSVARAAAATTQGMDHPNWLSYTPVYNAALRHMHVWLTEGKAPPVMPLIEAKALAGGPPEILRDERGNARGGIQMPAFAVPSAEHRGSGTAVQGGSRFAFLYGYAREFTSEELAELYSGRDDFLKKYDAELAEAVASGVLLEEEAPEMRTTAEEWSSKLAG